MNTADLYHDKYIQLTVSGIQRKAITSNQSKKILNQYTFNVMTSERER